MMAMNARMPFAYASAEPSRKWLDFSTTATDHASAPRRRAKRDQAIRRYD